MGTALTGLGPVRPLRQRFRLHFHATPPHASLQSETHVYGARLGLTRFSVSELPSARHATLFPNERRNTENGNLHHSLLRRPKCPCSWFPYQVTPMTKHLQKHRTHGPDCEDPREGALRKTLISTLMMRKDFMKINRKLKHLKLDPRKDKETLPWLHSQSLAQVFLSESWIIQTYLKYSLKMHLLCTDRRNQSGCS